MPKLKDWQRLLLFHIICAFSLVLADTLLTANIVGYYFERTPRYITESLLLTVPVWFLRGRWRLVVPVLLTIVIIFLWCNIMYARYTREFISPMLILSSGSYNSIVLSMVPSLIRLHDVIYLVCAVVPFFAYRLLRIGKCRTRSIQAIAMSGVCVAGALIWWPFTQFHASLRDVWLDGNICTYLVTLGKLYGQSKPIELTEAQKEQVSTFLQIHHGKNAHDKVLHGNKGKNLIFIVVESLNAWVVGADYGTGRSITPTIDSLLRCRGTISCLNMMSQITCGESSDGQFIYNTGLLPMNTNPVAALFIQNKYLPLATALDYKTATEYITEPKHLWNHENTNRQYGYNKIFDELRKGADGKITREDEKVLSFALSDIAYKMQPFFAFITTCTMHLPCEENISESDWINSIKGLRGLELGYLRMTHYFDACLGRFLKGLEREGLLENSVVVIASDHHKKMRASDPDDKPMPIVFIALNTGVTKRIEGPVGQIDVFPTVLDIMGVEGGWRGLGTTMLDSTNCSAVDRYGNLYGSSGAGRDSLKAKAWDISDLIIRGSYFGTR